MLKVNYKVICDSLQLIIEPPAAAAAAADAVCNSKKMSYFFFNNNLINVRLLLKPQENCNPKGTNKDTKPK